MRGMQYLHIQFWSKPMQLYKFIGTISQQNNNIYLRCKTPFRGLSRHAWVKAVMLFYSYITSLYESYIVRCKIKYMYERACVDCMVLRGDVTILFITNYSRSIGPWSVKSLDIIAFIHNANLLK